jgi:hypothetical protein
MNTNNNKPTSKELQSKYGLSRREVVQYNKEPHASEPDHDLIQQIKSKRQHVNTKLQKVLKNAVNKAVSELEVSHSADISLAEGHRLEGSL